MEEKQHVNILAHWTSKGRNQPEKYDARQNVMGAHLSKNTDVTLLVGRTLRGLSKKWPKLMPPRCSGINFYSARPLNPKHSLRCAASSILPPADTPCSGPRKMGQCVSISKWRDGDAEACQRTHRGREVSMAKEQRSFGV